MKRANRRIFSLIARLCAAGWLSYELLFGFMAKISIWPAIICWLAVIIIVANGILWFIFFSRESDQRPPAI